MDNAGRYGPRMTDFSSFLAADRGQTARTIHFISASFIVMFVVIHLVMVLITGVWNNVRSMITGRYVIAPAEEKS